MSRKTALFFLIATSTVLWGCATIVERQLIDEPDATFEGMSLKCQSLFELTPIFNFKVTNPNPMGMVIRNIAYNFKIDNKKFIKGVSDKNVWLKPVGSEELSLSVAFNYMDVFKSGAAFIGSEKISYELSGFVGAGPFAVPYYTKGDIRIVSNLPEISIKYIDISDFSFTRPFIMIFVVRLENPGSCALQLDSLNYTVKLGRKEFASGVIQHSSIDGNGVLTLEIPTNVTSSELNWSESNVLTDDSSEYEISGEMEFYIPRIGKRAFPFHKTGQVPYYKSK